MNTFSDLFLNIYSLVHYTQLGWGLTMPSVRLGMIGDCTCPQPDWGGVDAENIVDVLLAPFRPSHSA